MAGRDVLSQHKVGNGWNLYIQLMGSRDKASQYEVNIAVEDVLTEHLFATYSQGLYPMEMDEEEKEEAGLRIGEKAFRRLLSRQGGVEKLSVTLRFMLKAETIIVL